jgi:hypothetical protein
MLLAEGLDATGEHTLVKRVRESFCMMAQKSGMYENFDAVTGEGLRDPAYTWTSSVYLIFAHQLLGNSDWKLICTHDMNSERSTEPMGYCALVPDARLRHIRVVWRSILEPI